MSFGKLCNEFNMGMGVMPGAMMCGTACAALKENIFSPTPKQERSDGFR
jgi:hypothetical protein